jgi:PilZ domain
VNQEVSQSQPEYGSIEKLVHLALPVRLTHMANGGRGGAEMSCTYDIHPRGARLLSFRDVKVGDLIAVERGRNKSVCQVVWTADPNSPLRGQFTVECMEGRIPWEEELRNLKEQYLPVTPDAAKHKPVANNFRRGAENRRRDPRYEVEGGVDLAAMGGRPRAEGQLQQISEHGCLIKAGDLLAPGTGIRMVLNIYDVSVALKGNVRYTAANRAMGVEFSEIRQGDRPLLDYVLNQLKKPQREDFADLEVITDMQAAIAG